MRDLSYANMALEYLQFMIAFLQSMGKDARKNWSYHGVLPIRVPTDYATARKRPAFDPSNWVYASVVMAEYPKLQEAMCWANPPSDL